MKKAILLGLLCLMASAAMAQDINKIVIPKKSTPGKTLTTSVKTKTPAEKKKQSQPVAPKEPEKPLPEYVDLGLPSGTIWKSRDDASFYTYDRAISEFGNRLPSQKQWQELIDKCQWVWTDKGCKVIGPNGNYITFSAAGYLLCDKSKGGVDNYGYYWSGTPDGSEYGWCLYFYSSGVYTDYTNRCLGCSVRLIK